MSENDPDNLDSDSSVDRPIGRTKGGQVVVAREGDGSLTGAECQQDRNSLESTVVPFTAASTTFFARDASDPEKWDRLWKFQHGWDNDESGRRTHMDKVRLAQSLSDRLNLSRYQRGRVVKIVASLDGRRFNRLGGISALALGAIGFVGDQDARTIGDRIMDREVFDDLCHNLNADGRAAAKKIKQINREMSGDNRAIA